MRIAVTGAFGYSGRYIAKRLLAAGHDVYTLTNSPGRTRPGGIEIEARPFNFDQSELLTESLKRTDVLVNTYWVRFDHKMFNHGQAVANTETLFRSAAAAGVKRIVHVSITNPDADSSLPYFSGKAQLEESLKASGISYCILRPTVLFGQEDVLINNIAWGLRRMPVFPVFGDGEYRLQPIYVEDLAEAAAAKAEESKNEVIEAIGPETFTYRGLAEMIAERMGLNRRIISVLPELGYWGCRLLGLFVRDVVITREEIQGLMEERLYVDAPPLVNTKLTEWVEKYRETLGRRYTSEMRRRTNRRSEYRSN
jgi:NADH dehydrogenase